jgi:hypothetical protein
MSPTTTPSPTPRGTYDRAWARSVIGYWSHVWVRDVGSEPVASESGQDTVEITLVTVTARTTRDARRLAVLLDLTPEAPGPAGAWQAWAGWVSDASAPRPVLVRVIAFIGAASEAS